MKLVPLTVSTNAPPPAVAEFGLILVMVGNGFCTALIVKLTELEVPPPGAGLTTVTFAVPAAAMSVAGIVAVSCVALIKVVVRALPFHLTPEPATKPLPLIVNENPAPPAVIEFGFKFAIVGNGLLTVNTAADDVPPPGTGVLTVTFAVPAVAISPAGIAAVSCVALTKVVVRALPFHRTVEPFTKLLPFTVSVNAAPPTVAAFGLRLVIAGTGLLIVKFRLFELPPPGDGFNTTTVAVPATARSLAGINAVT